MTEEQLQLPYEEIKLPAGRSYLRDNFKVTSKVAYWIALDKIIEREGYNKRTDYTGVEELAESIFVNDIQEPFVLDICEDGRYFIKRGHRRRAAATILVNDGRWASDRLVKFFPSEKDETEEQKLLDQIISNEQKNFTPIEQAEVVHDTKIYFKKTNEEIAVLLGKSRQTIDNLIIIAEASDDLKNEIRLGNMSFTKALEFIRATKKNKKGLDKSEKENAQSAMYEQPSYKDPLQKEMGELEALDAEAEQLKKDNLEDWKEEVPEQESEEDKKQRELREETKKSQILEELHRVSDEVKATKTNLENHIGKKLSADIIAGWVEDFFDEDTADIVSIDRKEVVEYKGRELTEELANLIVEKGVDTIFVYKKGFEPIAKSVITESIGEQEKDKFSNDTVAMKQVQNSIKLNDRTSVQLEKMDVPEGVKKDILDWMKWQMKDLLEIRDVLHKNRKKLVL